LYSGVTKTKASKEPIFAPSLGVRLGVLPHGRGHGLVEQRQVEILDIHQLELSVIALLRDFLNPATDRLADAPRACASNDDC
jgi:hypothetical protein